MKWERNNMAQRLDYSKLSGNTFKKYFDFSNSVNDSSLDPYIKDLVFLRVSQMNGCAFCVDMHVKEAKIHGERELRLHHVAIWRESGLFNPKERAALEWAETLTKLPEHGVSDELYGRVRDILSEKEIADLSFVVVAINGWNRLSIGFRAVPGSLDAIYGLDKSGLN